MTEIMNRQFRDHEVQKELFTWWAGLEEHHRGDRAELRRCGTPDEVLLTEAYHRARRKLADAGLNVRHNHAELATVIGLLAHVRTHAPLKMGKSLGAQMASSAVKSDGEAKSESAAVSGLRFRRLLQVDSRDTLYRRLMAVVRLLNQSVDVNLLAKDAYYWSADTDNPVRQRWAMDYYGRAPQES